MLSACNTAAGGAQGAEALSGLARAFFYAGARAMLVSHWAVYSQAATELTTTTFAALSADAKAGRAEAFRRAMLGLIAKGKPPSHWAPFVIVGEGGAAGALATLNLIPALMPAYGCAIPARPSKGRGRLERLTRGRRAAPAEPGVQPFGRLSRGSSIRQRPGRRRDGYARLATALRQPFAAAARGSNAGASRPRSYERCDSQPADAVDRGPKGSLTS